MKMTIDDSIRELMWVRKVNEEILKIDAKELDIDNAWIKHWENVVKSLDIAIDIMRKYQKIVKIIRDYDVAWEFHHMKSTIDKIREVIKDGQNTNKD